MLYRSIKVVLVLLLLPFLTASIVADSHEDGRVMLTEDMLENEPTLGDDAPVTIVEYADFGCPWCAEWAGYDAIPQRPIDQENTLDKIKSNYIDSGDVRFVFKDYPVDRLHPHAREAHKAANCVLEQGQDKYWEYHDVLFEERDMWTEGGGASDPQYMADLVNVLAREAGVDEQDLAECYNNADDDEIQEDIDTINQLDGRLGTPTFFIGSVEDGFRKIEGAQPYSSLEPLIESEIEKERERGSVDSNETDTPTAPPTPGESAESHEIELNMGWNMISVPGTASVDQIQEDCRLQEYDGRTVWTFYNGSWHNPTRLQNERGYYVYAAEQCTATVDVEKEEFSWPTLGSGWTMVSGNGPLNAIRGTCTFESYQNESLWRLNQGSWSHPDELQTTAGYFVYIADTCRMGVPPPTTP